ncbi:hypothetical protein ACOL23_12730 [Aliarcobacter butzleri]
MMVAKGEIWPATLKPSREGNEGGQVGPVHVYQNDELAHGD